MPNWCDNEITISGSASELKQFLTDCGFFSDDQFSFNKLLPMPEELVGISEVYCDGGRIYEKVVDGVKTILSESEVYDLKTKYGAADWYDWNLKNWGTKWDVGNQASWSWHSEDFKKELDSMDPDEYIDISVSFDTAWGPPEELYKFITSKYKLDFDWFYKEPGMRFAGWL